MNSTEHQTSRIGTPSERAPQVTEQRISLASWVAANYAENDAPAANTVRRWVREKRIQPSPRKEGRSYFFSPAARYTDAPGSA
ncbi:excisionase [Methylibium petroleiphilum]|uniref:excisionase n=1 Tax=Methylibium petroleiphilum TaxID=105560 RepID=UPI00003CD2EC|nr:excisionase [Methylibium petroleiphilum]